MDYSAINQLGLENARFLLVDVAEAKENEKVTIICDDYTHPQANLLAICAKQLKLLPIIIDVSIYGTEYLTAVERPFLPHVKGALEASDIAFSFSPTYAWHLGGQKEFDAVHDGKRRFYTILGNGLNEWKFDKNEILASRKRTPVLRRLVSRAKTMRITTELGTDLTCDIGSENFESIYDVLSLVPFYSEVAIVPKVGTVSGKAVIDGASQRNVRPQTYQRRCVDEGPMTLWLDRGKLTAWEAPNETQRLALEDYVFSANPKADQVDEIGLVTVTADVNDLYPWSWWGDGTHHSKSVHIALGNNTSDRTGMIHATAHCDFDIYYPTIEIDGVVIYERDRFNDEYLFANDVCE